MIGYAIVVVDSMEHEVMIGYAIVVVEQYGT